MTPQGNPQRMRKVSQWLRPYNRWAAGFALSAPRWLPAVMRNGPLRLASLVLRVCHRLLR